MERTLNFDTKASCKFKYASLDATASRSCYKLLV